MIAALLKSVRQLGDRRVRSVLGRSVALTLLLFAIGWLALDHLLGGISPPDLPAWLQPLWLAGGDWAALPVVLAALFFLFPAVATAVMSLFLDDVVAAVEARHYPATPPVRDVGLWESMLMGLASAARVLVWNMLLLPLYITLLFTAIGPLLLFTLVNGWLMGRDFLEMVAMRHMERRSAAAWIRQHRGRRFMLGIGTAPMFLIPLVSLLAPILAASMATHSFHRARATRR